MRGANVDLQRDSKVSRAFTYRAIYDAAPADRIRIIKDGVQAVLAKQIVSELSADDQQRVLLDALHLSTATVNRKAARNEPLSMDEGERVVGLAKLVGQVQAMVEESGDPTNFDAVAWLSRWLREPLPALGGEKPIDLLETMEGQALVSTALAQIQSGAYV
jgi:putative toxin-antitoxin system antitoxin component (TIGR02293 family)